MGDRVRHRQISPQRIAKIAEALRARGLAVAIKLGTDGSVVLTDAADIGATSGPEGDAETEWDRALGIQ